MIPLCEKHRPECFADVKGQELAISSLKAFIRNFPTKKALILYGPAGTGKTSLAYSLAREIEAEIIELNASDLRNQEQIERILKAASEQQSLFAKKKVILIDEIDGISRDDINGISSILALMAKTKYPIILTANDIWDRKFNQIRRSAELIKLREINYKIIQDLLKQIADKENLIVSEEILKSISIKSRGDIRAAINDLQTVEEVNKAEDIHERDRQDDIFNVLRQVFKTKADKSTLGLYDSLSMNLDEIFLWLEENIPNEYSGEELYKAYDALSKADVFRGRIYRQQHWRFLVYQNVLLSAGVSSAKQNIKTGFTIYKKPERILKIWLSNQRLEKKKTIAAKYAQFCHISKKRALREFPTYKPILQDPNIQKQLKLNKEEIEFINNKIEK